MHISWEHQLLTVDKNSLYHMFIVWHYLPGSFSDKKVMFLLPSLHFCTTNQYLCSTREKKGEKS